MPRRLGRGVDDAVSAAAATAAATAASTTADGELPGRKHGECRHGLSVAAATTTAPDQAVGRTRIIGQGRRESVGPFRIR
jgi:hypothetical protein